MMQLACVVALYVLGCALVAYGVTGTFGGACVRSCSCGAHWWLRRWYFFWRHLDASPFNDKLQNEWTIWLFEFRRVLKLSPADLTRMGFPEGVPKEIWVHSKWQLSVRSESSCVRCAQRSL